MAPSRALPGVQHRIRQHHPLRPGMTRTLRRLDHADPDRIRRFQQARLRALVTVAAHRSPFYRTWFRQHRLDPRDIRTLADLAALPPLHRDDLVARADDFRVYPRAAMWPARSSGTSGRVVTAYRTAGSSAYELCVLQRQWGWFGIPPQARRIILRGSDFAADTGGAPVTELGDGRQLLVSSYRLTPRHLPEIVAAIRAFRPHVVEGWPSSITLLAALLRDHAGPLPMQAVVTSSETTGPGQRALIREVFGGPIVDHYGQTERVAMAGTCEAGGYHVFPDYGIVELVPVAGATGRWEIVGTPLHNWGFPVFRYHTGDHVGPAAADTCPCGRAFPLLGALDGRTEDAFTSADGRPLPLPATVIDDLTGLREAQIAQLAPGRFEVRVVPGAGFDAARTATAVRRNVDRLFGPGQHVSVVTTAHIPRRGGKLASAVVEHTGRRDDEPAGRECRTGEPPVPY